MDMIPLENLEPMEDNSYLSERAMFSRNREVERRLNQPKRKETFLDKIRATNELIGGVPRMAVEADEQPWEFYRLQARLEAADKVKNINHTVRLMALAIPPTSLDGEDAIKDVEFQEVPIDSPTQKDS